MFVVELLQVLYERIRGVIFLLWLTNECWQLIDFLDLLYMQFYTRHGSLCMFLY